MAAEPITYEMFMTMLHNMGERMEQSRKKFEEARLLPAFFQQARSKL